MALENLTVWTIPPDWQNEITETLEFLTGILTSPIGAEQRFSLRITPRRFFEMTFKPVGPTRTLFDLFMQRASGSSIYAPLWHDSNRLTASAVVGSSALTIASTVDTELADCPGVFIQGKGPFDYEIAQRSSVTATQILLGSPLVHTWPAGSRVFPLQKSRIETQPSVTRMADRAFTSRVKFSSELPNPTSASITLATYNDHFVLEREPNDVQDLTYTYARLMTELDSQTGKRTRFDLNAWGVTTQQFAFFLKGRADHQWARAFFYALAGRRIPLFIPTFTADLDVLSIQSTTQFIVTRCGLTDFGPPFRGREHIVFHFYNGTRLYRKIISSSLVGDGSTELVTIDTPFGVPVQPANLHRVSFLSLSRLDQDSLEIVHHTDTHGLATCTTLFRSIPQVRQPIPDPSEDNDDDTGNPSGSGARVYFEITPVVTGTNAGFGGGGYSICFGLAGSLFNLDNPHSLNFNTDDPGMAEGLFWNYIEEGDGDGWGYPARAASGPYLGAVNQVIGVAIDFSTSQIWLKNITLDSEWTGDGGGPTPDPVTGFHGYTFGAASGSTPIHGDVFILGGAGRDGTLLPQPVMTMNASGPFTGDLPTGFVAANTTFNSSDIAPPDMTTGDKLVLSNGDLTITAGVIPGASQPTAFVRSVRSWSHSG